MLLMGMIRWFLSRENARRDNEVNDDTYDNVYIEKVVDAVKVKVLFVKVEEYQEEEGEESRFGPILYYFLPL